MLKRTAHGASGRLLWLALAVVVLVPAGFQAHSASAQARVDGPVATVAQRYLGTHGGQCWTFMQQVVFEATGRHVGFDYREGFFEAGAIEVTAREAANGDIIQIADDSNTSPSAGYSGLHTAIILENLGGGVFDAIDSNQSWDEMVRLRPGYDPFAAAARYGLQVHIYRIPGGGPGESGSAMAASVIPGGNAAVATDSGCLNLRTKPGIKGAKIACLANHTAVTVTGETVRADGLEWAPVSTPAGEGWVAARYLVATETAPDPETAGPVSDDTADGVDQEPLPAQVDNSPGCLRVRSAGSLAASIVTCLPAGTVLGIVSEPGIVDGGYTWVLVRLANGTEGWVAGEFLVRR